MRSKKIYFILIGFFALIVIFISFFDYVAYFEKLYGFDKLDYRYTINYDVRDSKITPIRIIFSSIFFLSIFFILLISINGFKNRNTYVSRAEFLLAMTFGRGRKVKDGGTLDTVEKYLDRIITESLTNHSFHVDLHDCSIHKNCQI